MNYNVIKINLFVILLGVHSLYTMDNNQIFELAHQCDVQKLEGLVTFDATKTCDEQGNSLIMHAICGAFKHKRFDDFEKVIVLFQKNNLDFNAPIRCGSPVSNLSFLANIAMSNRNLIPLQIALKNGANPFSVNDNIFEDMLSLALHGESFAPPVVREMAVYANTLHDATKGVCVEAIAKHANKQTVQNSDRLGRTPLFYLLRSAGLASKHELCAAIKLLKDQGADVNSPIPNVEKKGYTYMHFATTVAQLVENTAVVEAMLDNGGSPLAGKDSGVMTPKQMAESMTVKFPFYKKISVIFNAHLLKKYTSQHVS